MKCSLCGYHKSYKHGKTKKKIQRYFCPKCKQTFTETFNTLYYRRQIQPEKIRIVLQAYSEGNSLESISKTVNLAYNTVTSLIKAASQKKQIIYNTHVQNIEISEIISD